MSVRTSPPAPRQNRSRSGFIGLADDLAGTDILIVAGDYTGGTSEDLFTLSSHGLITGDYVWLLYKTDLGAVTGRVGTGFRVKKLDGNKFQLTSRATGAVIENTADGTVILLKGTQSTSDAFVQTVVLPNLVIANGDYTGGATEDLFDPTLATGYGFLEEGDPMKLLYKAAAGVLTGIAAGTTIYAKSVTATVFETSATNGGADIENTADGLAVFIKTS